MANAPLNDDLIKEVEAIEDPQEAVVALLLGVAARVEQAAYGNVGVLREYAKSLREGSDQVTTAVLANTDVPAQAKK